MPRCAQVLLAAAGAFLWAVLGPAVPGSAGTVVDHGLYAELLRNHVRGALVDYTGMQKDEPLLDRYLELLARTDTGTLDRNERFAFFINAYNAWTIKLVLTRYPDLDSIKDIGGWFGSPWKKQIARIDGGLLTLDNIEHDILRPRFKDPRVHFAVNCASKGCPPLRNEPYTGAALDAQLDEQVRGTIRDPAFTRLEGNTLYVVKVFDWFREDFPGGAVPFVLAYAHGDLKSRLATLNGNVRVAYVHWDWALNDTP